MTDMEHHITVVCKCHNKKHIIDLKKISVRDAGMVLVLNRKKKNSPEHMKRISALGVQARKDKALKV